MLTLTLIPTDIVPIKRTFRRNIEDGNVSLLWGTYIVVLSNPLYYNKVSENVFCTPMRTSLVLLEKKKL